MMAQLRVAVSKLREDLDELQSPVLHGGELPMQGGASSPRLEREHQLTGSGQLAYYH